VHSHVEFGSKDISIENWLFFKMKFDSAWRDFAFLPKPKGRFLQVSVNKILDGYG